MAFNGESATLAVSTDNGGYFFTSGADRKSWSKGKRFLAGESVNSVSRDRNGGFFAATLTEGVFRSDDFGKTWSPSSRGLNVRKVWTVEPDKNEDGLVYAGTHYGHLFRSSDSGKHWEEVTGLHKAPLREKWGIDWAMGTIGMALHTVKSVRGKKGSLYVVAAGTGPYLTKDSGGTWEIINNGVKKDCPVGAQDTYEGPSGKSADEILWAHLDEVHSCTHKLALSESQQGLIYQQNHCGVYRSDDGGLNWSDISPSTNIRHGFPITLVEGGSNSLFVIPAYQGKCKKHNSCIQGKLEVLRTDDGGRQWKHLTSGLPADTHSCVLRDGMASDSSSEPGVYFGTTSGEVYASTDRGKSWNMIASGLGRIQGISAFAI